MIVSEERRTTLWELAIGFPSVTLTPRQICDLELLICGGFSPLRGFLNRRDYESVLHDMRLECGTLWPMPITLDVSDEVAKGLAGSDHIVLRDPTGLALAVLHLEDRWKPDKVREAELVFGTACEEHPGVGYLMQKAKDWYVGGTVEGFRLPPHHDFQELRKTPAELREYFDVHRWERIVAFQTRNPMHRAHKELTDRAARDIDGKLLIHPVVGMTKPGDVDHFTRVRSYKKLLTHYEDTDVTISLLPLAMRMGGPREAVWHAIIRKNYGCTHLIVGRDHAGPGKTSMGQPFYGPYEAQDLVEAFSKEIGVGVVRFRIMVYAPATGVYKPIDEVAEGEETLSISGTEFRRRLEAGEEIPEWFSYPTVLSELLSTYPPREQQGFTIFFTGFSGSGKSTIANGVRMKLLERTARPVTLLDGDIVRRHLSKGLGFSAKGRSANVQRIGYVASEVTRHRGVVICAAIAPYAADRKVNRDRIECYGGYVEVFVDAPIDVCEERDVKGLYAKARAGIIKGFTGIDDPYEAPIEADVVCHTDRESVEECVHKVMAKLTDLGFLPRIA